tara:strand:- start:1259 stop:1471 length:213 start_codon:yes stop_codon:yes gene_type:complete
MKNKQEQSYKMPKLNRAFLLDSEDDIYAMYQEYIKLVTNINPTSQASSEIAASNLVVAKQLQKVINLIRE